LNPIHILWDYSRGRIKGPDGWGEKEYNDAIAARYDIEAPARSDLALEKADLAIQRIQDTDSKLDKLIKIIELDVTDRAQERVHIREMNQLNQPPPIPKRSGKDVSPT